MEEFILRHREELDCIDIIVKSEEQKQTIWKILQQQVDDVYITSSVRQLLEISHVNAGKDTAAEFLARRLGITGGKNWRHSETATMTAEC